MNITTNLISTFHLGNNAIQKFLLQGKLQGTLWWANNTISEINLLQLVCFQSRSPPWHFGRGSICILFGSSSIISGQKKRTYRNTNSFSSGMAMMFGQARLLRR
jgi:hypothetical protein